MSIEMICREVARLKQLYNESEPERLVRSMDILLSYQPMGTSTQACKGFFIYQSQIKSIVINSELPRALQRIVLAHEAGHAVLHEDVARLRAFHDFSLYDASSVYEYEANLFAAEYLLDDEQVAEKLGQDTFFFGVARELAVPAELLDFKFRILKKKGWQIESPIVARSDFLKDI